MYDPNFAHDLSFNLTQATIRQSLQATPTTNMVRCAALVALALGLGLGLGLKKDHPQTQNQGPNVLVIMTDDQGELYFKACQYVTCSL